MSHRNKLNTIDLPGGWNEFEYSEYALRFFHNQLAFYEHKRGSFLRIERIDRIFFSFLQSWKDPKGPIPALLCLRTHSTFRVASIVTMAGALTEAFAMQRLCLEQAGYALRMHVRRDLAEAWLRRDEGAETAKPVRKEFTHQKIRDAIRAIDEHTAEVYSELYERCISWGAHPNEKAVTSSGSIIKTTEGKRFDQIYLHGDSQSMDMTLRSLMLVGV